MTVAGVTLSPHTLRRRFLIKGKMDKARQKKQMEAASTAAAAEPSTADGRLIADGATHVGAHEDDTRASPKPSRHERHHELLGAASFLKAGGRHNSTSRLFASSARLLELGGRGRSESPEGGRHSPSALAAAKEERSRRGPSPAPSSTPAGESAA